MDYTLICILGLVIGSFLNVCIYRIPIEKSIAFPPSHCTTCKHKLNPLDLVPVFSYIFLRGKCRYCGEKISIRYPLIEILNGLLYLIVYAKFGLDLITIKYCILVSLLIVISAIDFDTQFVFTSTTIFGGIAGILFILLQYVLYKNNVLDLIIGGILGAIIIGLIVFLTRGMGEGDIEIAAVCGLFLGVKGILLGLFLTIALGGIIGVIVLILKLKKAKEKIAFGPFLAIGSLISMLYGVEILKVYWNLLL
ncbi:prepilin peptidase [Clostridium beijerinckii]|uniref:prepilin peptidase n=1 Tax=Clostridium beijerinckii TaxID=1520 RepID=UPI0022E31A8D|nr:A24 family peptidase [Clostridium beijerinckii]